jgi:hypothetical protein
MSGVAFRPQPRERVELQEPHGRTEMLVRERLDNIVKAGPVTSKLLETAQGLAYPIKLVIKGCARNEEKKRHESEAQKKALEWNQQRGPAAFCLGNSARNQCCI